MKTLIVLAAVGAFGVVLSVALVIFGQKLSGVPTARWTRVLLLAALTMTPVLAVIEAVAR
jgi:hypothetical protein